MYTVRKTCGHCGRAYTFEAGSSRDCPLCAADAKKMVSKAFKKIAAKRGSK